MIKKLKSEQGAILFVVIAVMFGLLLFTPFLIDYASLHTAHRVAQTAADSAAHAAAVSCARELSVNTGAYEQTPLTWGACCTCVKGSKPKQLCVLGIYQALFVWVKAGMMDCLDGQQQARHYATRNGAKLANYDMKPVPFAAFYTIPRVKWVDVIAILPVKTEVSVKRRVPLIYQAVYGQKFEVRAHARAEAYLNKYQRGTQVCAGPCKPWVGTVPTYDMKWQVRIVE